jgi:uncharacterized membrane protein
MTLLIGGIVVFLGLHLLPTLAGLRGKLVLGLVWLRPLWIGATP